MIYERVQLKQAYWVLLLFMLVLLTAFTLGMTWYQWNLLLDHETETLKYDLKLAAEFIKEDLSKEQYDHIDQFFNLWANKNPRITTISAVARNDFQVASFHRDGAQGKTIRLTQAVDGSTPLDLKVDFDVSYIQKEVKKILFILIGANIFFIAILMLIMWVVMRRYLIKPLIDSEDKLLDLATLDSLTQIYNRASFLASSRAEIERCKRTGNQLCIAMLDLDYFKKINDHFGHATGDLVLLLFSTELKIQLRSYDVIGRIGGEEFALCLPEIPLGQGVERVQKICERTGQLPRLEGKVALNISVSIGITEMKPDDTLEAMLARSDKALYEAKENGRNCVRKA